MDTQRHLFSIPWCEMWEVMIWSGERRNHLYDLTPSSFSSSLVALALAVSVYISVAYNSYIVIFEVYMCCLFRVWFLIILIILFNVYLVLYFFCRKNFKHINKILFVNGFFTITIFVDKKCWRILSLYDSGLADCSGFMKMFVHCIDIYEVNFVNINRSCLEYSIFNVVYNYCL